MSLASQVTLLAGAIRDKINAMMPRLLPSGGTTGQVLAKSSATDYATGWTTASGGASNVTIGTSAPTPATGVYNLWLDTTGGSTRMKIVVGD